MKWKLNIAPAEKMLAFIRKYKFILIIMLVGCVVLMIPTKDERSGNTSAEGVKGEEDFSIETLEMELSEILSKIEGAGRVSVMLTAQSGTERILATNREMSTDGQESELQEKTVIISVDNSEETVLIGQNYPVFRGALVVCPGGDNPEVVLMLTKALSALTGLSSSRITVCKGS